MSEYNEKICPNCNEINDIDADHCYWCKYKFHDINKEISKTHCKYCHTPIEVNEFYDTSKGAVCKKCRKAKIGYNILFYFLGIVIYLILNAMLFSFGFKLGYLFTLLLFFAPHKLAEKFMINKSTNNSAQQPTPTINTNDISKDDELTQKVNKSKSEETQIKDIKKTKKEKLPKKRYCKLCGGLIDNDTKKCSNCSKQYFKIKKPKFNKFVCIITIFAVMILTLAGLNVYQYINYNDYIIKTDATMQELNNEIDNLNSTIKSKTQTINYWRGLYNSQENTFNSGNNEDLEWYEENVAVIYDNGTNLYHKHRCLSAIKTNRNVGCNSYWIYNIEAAEQKGYTKCPDCH